MRKVWLVLPDTNFLFIPGQFGVDIISEFDRILDVKYQVAIPNVVLEELKTIIKEGKVRGKDLMAARMALKLAERFPVVYIGEFMSKTTDELLYEYAIANDNVIVCTNDKKLRKRLREAGVPVIFLRQKKKLELEGMLE
ncbi:PIN domain-containing protein [Pyrococcus kukulkanii]|uniref:Nucleotide-binding protein n=1 Tax=Pyrococcus kukulkanii TaxID=1609559 RepID=A0A127BAW9_9EURY|nr:PIN domain-containing protein [Pyrococcus kukulkanii]AMM54472.1 nucleotide-binding protein [Pyrococcus kukulkanii]